MAETAQRRGHHEDSIYFDASKNRWIGAISLGLSPDGQQRERPKVRGKTKAEVRDKLRALHRELEAGLRVSATYTVASCARDWLADGLVTQQASTAENYRRLADHVIGKLGAVKLKDLTARQVQKALAELSASLSTRSLRLVHQILERAIRHAQASDLVGRNVASLVSAPTGRPGRPSRSLTLSQAADVLETARDTPLHAYVTLSLLTGVRTEELRKLLRSDVDLDAGTLAVYRSVRAGGDTKTPKSRRMLKLPAVATAALRDHRTSQAAARHTPSSSSAASASTTELAAVSRWLPPTTSALPSSTAASSRCAAHRVPASPRCCT